MPPQLLPGFRDFFPEQFALRAYIFETWRRVVRRYAFVEYDGPPLESLDLYTQKSGDEIVTQLYNFADKGGRDVALRPEMTPTFARMVGARAQAAKRPPLPFLPFDLGVAGTLRRSRSPEFSAH